MYASSGRVCESDDTAGDQQSSVTLMAIVQSCRSKVRRWSCGYVACVRCVWLVVLQDCCCVCMACTVCVCLQCVCGLDAAHSSIVRNYQFTHCHKSTSQICHMSLLPMCKLCALLKGEGHPGAAPRPCSRTPSSPGTGV